MHTRGLTSVNSSQSNIAASTEAPHNRAQSSTSGPGSDASAAVGSGPGSAAVKSATAALAPPSAGSKGRRLEVKVHIPEALRPVLVDDWDAITRQFRLLRLPADRSVKTILDDYMDQVRRRDVAGGGGATKEEATSTKGDGEEKDDDAMTSDTGVDAVELSRVDEIVKGIREYFDEMLGTQLLYKFERLQYADARKEQPGVPPSCLYGAVHLLRLFVRFGHMLAYANYSERHVGLILAYVERFLGYLEGERARLFVPELYITASPQYQRLAYS